MNANSGVTFTAVPASASTSIVANPAGPVTPATLRAEAVVAQVMPQHAGWVLDAFTTYAATHPELAGELFPQRGAAVRP